MITVAEVEDQIAPRALALSAVADFVKTAPVQALTLLGIPTTRR
jgi:hypothetical protein